MSREQELKKIGHLLQQRRADLVSAFTAAQSELDALKAQERDPEYEEGAQTDLADFTLSKLMDNQRTELQAIDGALARLEAGTFGTCVDCDGEIEMRRLQAVPFALRCEEDAAEFEENQRGGAAHAHPSL